MPNETIAADQTGVIIGLLLSFDKDGTPLVAYEGVQGETVRARTTTELKPSDIGSQVALMFENGQWLKPLVIGKIFSPTGPARKNPAPTAPQVTATVDDQVLTLTAKERIVLRCGKASITLTESGKVLIRGDYTSVRSTGINRVKGGSVQIN